MLRINHAENGKKFRRIKMTTMQILQVWAYAMIFVIGYFIGYLHCGYHAKQKLNKTDTKSKE